MVEYVVFGVVPGKQLADLLIAQPNGKPITNRNEAERYAKLCRDKGATKVRVSRIDLSVPPDFAATVNV